MKQSDINWGAFFEKAVTVLQHYLRKWTHEAPGHRFYVLSLDAWTYDGYINPMANTIESLEKLAAKRFPDRPQATSFRVLKWDMDSWKYHIQSPGNGAFQGDALSEFWDQVYQISEEDPEWDGELHAREFRKTLVRAFMAVEDTAEFADFPKTEDFELQYYEDESRIFQNRGEMLAFLETCE